MMQPDATAGIAAATMTRQLLDIVNGSWMSQAAYVAADLRIPDLLGTGSRSAEELAHATGAHAASLRRLLRALVTIEICGEQADGTYELTAMGSLLRTGTADSLRSWTLHWGGSIWSTWGNLRHSVMTGNSARKLASGSDTFELLDADATAAAIYDEAMVELTRLDSATIAGNAVFSGMARIVDVGGGYGALLAAILRAQPQVRGVLFDRPHAVGNGIRFMEAAGLAERCEFVTGDFFESIPRAADAYVLKSVIHDWNDEHAAQILRNCAVAMQHDAKLLLVERIFPSRMNASAAHRAMARADLNMLVGLGGRERTQDEYRDLLTASGFVVNAIHPAGLTFSIIEATPSR
jgi:orsellinic acid C2-O-methyltransferase